jgi:hypothetical protein
MNGCLGGDRHATPEAAQAVGHFARSRWQFVFLSMFETPGAVVTPAAIAPSARDRPARVGSHRSFADRHRLSNSGTYGSPAVCYAWDEHQR